jgi:hypothetical protein
MHCSQGVLYLDKTGDPPLALWACESFTSAAGYQLAGTYHSACVGQPEAGFAMVEYTQEEILYDCYGRYIANMTGQGPCHLPP